MQFWQTLVEYINTLDYKRYQWYQYIYLTVVLCCFVCIIGIFFQARHAEQKKYIELNKVRSHIQHYLTEYQAVRTQKDFVDEMLKKDSSFYLQKYTEELLQSTSIAKKNIANLVVTDLANGYTEESLAVKISGITTDVLVALLQKIEQTPRVYIKNISITADKTRTIQVSLALATLKPKKNQQRVE